MAILTEEQRGRKRRQYGMWEEFTENEGVGFGQEAQPEQYQQLLGMQKELTTSGAVDYDKEKLESLAKKGGVDIPPPTSMPLAPELTRSADRQKIAQRRRRGRSSTMLSGAGLGGGGDSLG